VGLRQTLEGISETAVLQRRDRYGWLLFGPLGRRRTGCFDSSGSGVWAAGDEVDVANLLAPEACIETLPDVLLQELQFLHPGVTADAHREDAAVVSGRLRTGGDGFSDLVGPEGPDSIDASVVWWVDALEDPFQH
jgi:hypothetical protein